MVAPPPLKPGFTKKTWTAELIPSAYLNDFEDSIDELFYGNIELTGDKTFTSDLVTSLIDFFEDVGLMYHDGVNFLIKSLLSSSPYCDVL